MSKAMELHVTKCNHVYLCERAIRTSAMPKFWRRLETQHAIKMPQMRA